MGALLGDGGITGCGDAEAVPGEGVPVGDDPRDGGVGVAVGVGTTVGAVGVGTTVGGVGMGTTVGGVEVDSPAVGFGVDSTTGGVGASPPVGVL